MVVQDAIGLVDVEREKLADIDPVPLKWMDKTRPDVW